jgi:soluble lytic murein transglycosylase
MPHLPRSPAVRAARASALAIGATLSLAAEGGQCAAQQPSAAADGAVRAATPTARALALDPALEAEAAAAVRAARALEARGAAADSAGRAWDRSLADSARAAYLQAAALAPVAGDWLRLRALALQSDPGLRARERTALAAPAVRERAQVAEATARVRAGDLAGAADAWEVAGAEGLAAALRLRTATGPDALAARDRTRAVLQTLLRDGLARVGAVGGLPATRTLGPDRTDLREAATLLDSAFAPLPPAERLLAARALDVAGGGTPTLTRAAQGYAAALDAGVGTATDRAALGALLARLGRWREAAQAYARAAADPALGGSAGYQEARARLRAGDGPGARARLRRVVAEHPSDAGAADARYLLADLAIDDGREAEARVGFRAVAQLHPGSARAPLAAFRGAILGLADGSPDGARTAAAELDALAARWPEAAERGAATYWAGRAWERVGDAPRARERWAAVLARDPASYYAGLAARRLSRTAWSPAPAAIPTPTGGERAIADAAAARAALLERLGMGPEAGYERDWLTRWADSSVARQLGAAQALQTAGRPGVSIRLAGRAIERGAPRSSEVYRLLYPLLYAGTLQREAAARGVEPALAAALVKQESNFTADAVSPVGARGLMQLMPDVGRSIWSAQGASARGAWSPALLFDPEVNLALGMRHLRAALNAWPHPAFALAAYNAGGSRVRRWRRAPGADDPELFVERIPYEETRDYVRIVLRSRDLYRALYPEVLAAR